MKLIVAAQNGSGQGAAPAPSQDAGAPGDASPGSSAPVAGEAAVTLLSRLADPKNVGPGLLVIAGSLVALAATRFIRAEQDRKAYRRYYSATWG